MFNVLQWIIVPFLEEHETGNLKIGNMLNASHMETGEEDVLDLELNTVLFPEKVTLRDAHDSISGSEADKNLLPTPYLPPYLNPSRYPTVFQNSSNSTFEILFQFTPTITNILLLVSLVTCTLWVIVMNLLLIGALRKAHERDKEHVTDMYLTNLLFADVLVGVFVFPFMSIVILIGYFPFSGTWCNLWVYLDYYLIIASSYGFAALMCSYLMMLRWPDYYPKSRRLHTVVIFFIWIFSNAPWTAPFINDRLSFIYPDGVCGFSIQKNRYFTLYIGFTGFYVPLGVALVAGIFAVKHLKQTAQVPFLKLLLKNERCHIHPFVPSSSATSEAEEFNDLYRIRRNKKGEKSNFGYGYGYPRQGLSPSGIPSESTDRSDSPRKKQRYSLVSIRTFQRNKALYDSVKKHFPLVATSLILFVLCRSLFYTYFGIGSVVPELFPPDLSHSVYWVMHSYAVLAPVVHLMFDPDLRRSVIRFINEGTFQLSPLSEPDEIIDDRDRDRDHDLRNRKVNHGLQKVSVIDAQPKIQANHEHSHRNHHNNQNQEQMGNHHQHHNHHHHHNQHNNTFQCNGNVRIHDMENYHRMNGFYQ